MSSIKNRFITICIILIYGFAGYIFGSFFYFIDVGSKRATINIPYFDLLVDDEKYFNSIKKNFDSLVILKSTNSKKLINQIKVISDENISDDVVIRLIKTAKINLNTGEIIISLPATLHLKHKQLNAFVDALIFHLNESSAEKYLRISQLLKLKQTLLAQGYAYSKNDMVIKDTKFISATEVQTLIREVEEIEFILAFYESNQYSASYDTVNPFWSSNILSFKLSFLFIILGSILSFKSLREKILSLIFKADNS